MSEELKPIEKLQQALNVWTARYADDMVSKADVAAASKAVHEAGGTLAYIAEANAALDQLRSTIIPPGYALVPVELKLDVLAASYEAMFTDKWDATQAAMMAAGWKAVLQASTHNTKEGK